ASHLTVPDAMPWRTAKGSPAMPRPDQPEPATPLTDLRLLRTRLIDERRTLISAMLQSHGADEMSKHNPAEKLQAVQHMLHDLDAAIAPPRGQDSAGRQPAA
ncbi:MAG: hypothetical protein ACRCYS_09960, partial [Beijerinckiaceae bacterium]